ncbi:triosephosphate isomerase [secondary endosymbiont of Heteropsylla cubana]|uniref:Triosephosphate isomerase n=1 Tax=secondary endosymbiont of Heteropsylla cubana TaxID=134287 RepID=J3Z543_9ENTR|nr:triose-phosphate isomerase [secondary endosymbiont of Heteropsylla cubana]AFP85414.1 triosephosphate isomerase [secondary endosymbiont of Heteropsylla cubana]
MRNYLIIGNWKLNGTKEIINNRALMLRSKINNTINCDVAVAPPLPYLHLTQHYLKDTNIALCAQNIDIHTSGAYTGDISPKMLKDIGAKYSIIGHSERRLYHKENNELIAEKFAVLKKSGLIPVLCIGESEEERRSGQTQKICINQIDAIINKVGITAFQNSVIAYEPIWAIGTGKAALPSQAQKIHEFIRSYINEYDSESAKQVIIQYGGSVNIDNAAALFNQPDVDGALIGSASLNPDIFSILVKIALERKK